jgi:hypothetical protein
LEVASNGARDIDLAKRLREDRAGLLCEPIHAFLREGCLGFAGICRIRLL